MLWVYTVFSCEYGRRETLSQCCSNAGPPSSMAASVWRLVGRTQFMFITHDDRLLYPASFSKSIALRVEELSLSNLYHYFQHQITFLVIFITYPYDHN